MRSWAVHCGQCIVPSEHWTRTEAFPFPSAPCLSPTCPLPQQAQAGAPPEPPADLLSQIGALGGAEAEAEARRVYGRPWEAVDATTLEARVCGAATRATYSHANLLTWQYLVPS